MVSVDNPTGWIALAICSGSGLSVCKYCACIACDCRREMTELLCNPIFRHFRDELKKRIIKKVSYVISEVDHL